MYFNFQPEYYLALDNGPEFNPNFYIGLNVGTDICVDWERMDFVCLGASLAQPLQSTLEPQYSAQGHSICIAQTCLSEKLILLNKLYKVNHSLDVFSSILVRLWLKLMFWLCTGTEPSYSQLCLRHTVDV